MLPDERPTERLARSVACPQCGAKVHSACRVLDSWGKPIKRITDHAHLGRLKKAQARR